MRRIQLLFILAAISSACSQPGNDSSQTKSLHPDAQTPTVFAVDTVKSSCQAAAPQNINITMSTGLAASPPPGIAGANMDASGKVWAFIENGPRGMFVQINGKTHPTFDTIEKEKGVFDQSGHHFAYSAERSGKWFVVRDGVTSKASYDGIYNESVIFDPTGTHLVFNAKLNGQSFAVLDGVEQAHFDDLSPVAFSDDGSHSAYTALKDGSGFLIIDGETKVKTPGRGSMIPVWMHADKFAYLINAGETLQVIVPDGLPQPFLKEFTYDKPLVWSLRFAKQGQRYSYFGRLIDGRLVAVIDGRLVGPFTKMGNSPVFSPDGQHYAFAAAIEDGKWVVIRDGSYDPATSFQGIGPILFSKDGSRLIFAASTTGNNWVVSDNDCISASYLGINGIGFLGNGIVSYLAEKTTGMLLVVNGKEFPVRGSLVYSNVVKNA